MTATAKNGAVVFVKYLDRAVAFYRDTMALTVTHAEDGLAVLENASSQLVLHALPPRIARSIVIDDPPVAREDTAVKLVFHVDDLAAACANANARGGRFDPPLRQFDARGFRAIDGTDPEGNVVQLRVLSG
ncbi:MAG TPA: VOC family protein [Tahibacter sp.]|nr:VOC family protein [Tahibacter sp.]